MLNKLSVKYILLVVSAMLFLQACERHIQVDVDRNVPVSPAYFNQQKGVKLPYKLYFPNSFTGWLRESEFEYSDACQCYQILNLDISGEPIDSWGTRFKIASKNWQHEFGFTSAHNNLEQAKFGVTPQGTIVGIHYHAYAADMYFELPKNGKTNYLHVKLKVLSNDEEPEGLLSIAYSAEPIALPNE